MNRTVPAILISIVLVMLIAALVPTPCAEVKMIDLRFAPNETDEDLAPVVPGDVLEIAIRIEDVTDGRQGLPDPSVIGRFRNKDIEVRADRSVPAHVTDTVHRLLEHWNLTVAPDGSRVLESELRLFEVEVESGAFNANVHVLFRLRDDEKETYTYQAIHAGHDGTVGLRGKEANYNQVLSNALREAVVVLLSDTKFHEALRGNANSIVVTVITPANLLNLLIPLQRSQVSEETLLQFVRDRRIRGPFTADDVAAWKEAGMPETVLREAKSRAQ